MRHTITIDHDRPASDQTLSLGPGNQSQLQDLGVLSLP